MSRSQDSIADFDRKINFNSSLQKVKQQNQRIDSNIEKMVRDELKNAEKDFGKSSVQYRFFERVVIEILKKHNSSVDQLRRELSIAKERTQTRVQEEIQKLSKDVHITNQYDGFDLAKTPTIAAAKAINLNSSIKKMLDGEDFRFRVITKEEREKLSQKPFSLTEMQSWKETALLLGEDIGNSIKDLILLITSIPSSTIALKEYITIRNNRDTSIENEAKLQHLVDQFPALALVDMVTDIDKLSEVFSILKKELTSGTQGGVALAIGLLVSLIGGVAVTNKLSKLSKVGKTKKTVPRKVSASTPKAQTSTPKAQTANAQTSTPKAQTANTQTSTPKAQTANAQIVNPSEMGQKLKLTAENPQQLIEKVRRQGEDFINKGSNSISAKNKKPKLIPNAIPQSQSQPPKINIVNSQGKTYKTVEAPQKTATSSSLSQKQSIAQAPKKSEIRTKSPKELAQEQIDFNRKLQGELTNKQIEWLNANKLKANRNSIESDVFIAINQQTKRITLKYNTKTKDVQAFWIGKDKKLIEVGPSHSKNTWKKLGIEEKNIHSVLQKIQKEKAVFTQKIQNHMKNFDNNNTPTKTANTPARTISVNTTFTGKKQNKFAPTLGIGIGGLGALGVVGASEKEPVTPNVQPKASRDQILTQSTINKNRQIKGHIATEEYRNNFNKTWITYPMWQNTIKKWNEYYQQNAHIQNATNIHKLIQQINTNPQYQIVQQLQSILGIDKNDNTNGQDGMLGKYTITKLRDWIKTNTINTANNVAMVAHLGKNDSDVQILTRQSSTPITNSGYEQLTPTPLSANVATPDEQIINASNPSGD